MEASCNDKNNTHSESECDVSDIYSHKLQQRNSFQNK